MCLNQVDHVFGQVDNVFKPPFFIWCYVFQEKNEGDHVFKSGLLVEIINVYKRLLSAEREGGRSCV